MPQHDAAHPEHFDDPIVAEVRKARLAYFASCGNDLDRMFDDLQRREAEHPERVVSIPSTPVKPAVAPQKKSA
jgi:hypothetical protein